MQAFFTLLSQIKKGNFAPFYLFSGTEPYYIDVLTSALLEHLVNPASKDFDCTYFYGKEAVSSEIIETAKRFPMLASRNVIVIKEAQNLNAETLDELAQYVEHPTPSTVLIFCYKHKQFDKRKKLYKAAQKNGEILDTKPVYENQLPQWIRDRAAALKMKIDPTAVELLSVYIGTDLTAIEKALEKLQVAIGKEAIIFPQHIEQYIGINKAYNSFELQKAIGLGHFSKAFEIIQYLNRNNKEHPLVLILSTLHNYFQKLLLIKGMNSQDNITTVLGISPYFIKEYQTAANRLSMHQISNALHCILKADLKCKGIEGSSQNDARILEELLLKLFTLT